jgi:hypothetical protein
MADVSPDGGAARPKHRTGAVMRAPIVAALAAALIVGGLSTQGGGGSHQVTAPPLPAVPVAAPPQALSSSWFCAGATDKATVKAAGKAAGKSAGKAKRRSQTTDNSPRGAVVIANSASGPAAGVVTLVGSHGPSTRIPVSVAPDSRTAVAENLPGGAPWVGAIVDINAGAVAVEQQITGPLGQASVPCATAGSAQWFFATGATLINANVVVSLLNPYPTVAVVNLSFTTNQGLEQPQPFQAIVVPPGALVAVNLGDELRRRQAIATSIIAQSGRVVAWKTDVVIPPAAGAALLGTPAARAPLADPAASVPGVTLTLGVPAPSTTWIWPDGDAGNGVAEQYVIYNPSTKAAELRLAVDLAQGVAEPFTLSVDPYQVTTVVSSVSVRIPPGVEHAAVLTSTNDVPVVAERTIAAGASSGWSGLGELPGGQLAANRWLLPYFPADMAHTGRVVLLNPSATPARVDLSRAAGASQPLDSVTVSARRWTPIPLNDLRSTGGGPLLVTASEPVYVESDFYGKGKTTGTSLSFGVPLTP